MAAISDFFLNSGVISPTSSLVDFLSLIFSGKKSLTSGIKTSRFSQSIAEDICVAVTRGRWKMPKHVVMQDSATLAWQCRAYNSAERLWSLSILLHDG